MQACARNFFVSSFPDTSYNYIKASIHRFKRDGSLGAIKFLINIIDFQNAVTTEVDTCKNMFLHVAIPTEIVTEQRENRGSSVGGIVAGVTIPVLLLIVVAVVEVIAGVWLWRRYVCTVYMTLARVDLY